MAITQSNDEKRSMADEDEPRRKDEPRKDYRPPAQPMAQLPAVAVKHGFFTIYKSGQGYWTRLGTIAAAALIGILTAYNMYVFLPVWGVSKNAAIGAAAGFIVGFGILVFFFSNKPRNVDFLIATDSEMKKVNWTTRKELIGSTKVVIIFMFLIAFLLFFIDILFGYFFYLIKVLLAPPF